MLQRSWTVERTKGEDVAGAVYVGRASFRMGGTPAVAMPTVIVDQAVAAADAAVAAAAIPFADPGRMPTERIVLAPPSSESATSATSSDASRPRRAMFLFGTAFAVGVLCTVVGQTAIRGGATASRSVRPLPVAAPVSARLVAVGDPARRGAEMATLESLPSTEPTEPTLADGAVHSSPSLEGEASGATTARVHAVAHARSGRRLLRPETPEAKSARHASQSAPSKWVDPFAAGDDAASDVTEEKSNGRAGKSTKNSKNVNASNDVKTTASAKGAAWVDPFAE